MTRPAASQVENQTEQLLARAPLVCYAVVYPTGERRMACEVAEVRWWLLTTTPSLKVAPLTYMVAMPGERVFYSVTFAEDTPPEVGCADTCTLGCNTAGSFAAVSSCFHAITLTSQRHATALRYELGAFPASNLNLVPDAAGMVGAKQYCLVRLVLAAMMYGSATRQAVGAFEALLEEVTVYNESERLIADPAVESGDRAIAEGMVGRYDGLHFENKWAERLHQTSMKVSVSSSARCSVWNIEANEVFLKI